MHPLAQILSYLIQQADALSFFHNFEEHQLRGRRTGQVAMERELQCCDGEFGPFQHVEDEAAVQGGRLVRRQGGQSRVFTSPGIGALAKITNAV